MATFRTTGSIVESSSLNNFFIHVKFILGCVGCEVVEEEDDGLTVYVDITGHSDDNYNGRYWQTEDWAGFEHFTKEDGTTHLYYLSTGSYGYWQLDNRV